MSFARAQAARASTRARLVTQIAEFHSISCVCIPRTVARPVACSSTSGAGTLQFEGPGRQGEVHFTAVSGYDRASSAWNYRSLRDRLASAGLAGLAAYGIMNGLYYWLAFTLCWCGVAGAQRGQGYAAAATMVAKTLAIVWAGSQVTKLPRAALALAATPFADRLLGWLRNVAQLQTKRKAFFIIVVPACWMLFILTLGVCMGVYAL